MITNEINNIENEGGKDEDDIAQIEYSNNLDNESFENAEDDINSLENEKDNDDAKNIFLF